VKSSLAVVVEDFYANQIGNFTRGRLVQPDLHANEASGQSRPPPPPTASEVRTSPQCCFGESLLFPVTSDAKIKDLLKSKCLLTGKRAMTC